MNLSGEDLGGMEYKLRVARYTAMALEEENARLEAELDTVYKHAAYLEVELYALKNP